MAVTYEKYMEQLYTLMVSFNLPGDDPEAVIDVPIDAEHEDIWIDRLGFEPGVGETRYFSHPTEPDFSGLNKFDVLAIVHTLPEEPQEPMMWGLSFVAFYRILYVPTNLAGNRVIVQFYAVPTSAGSDTRYLATLGLSHSINR